jgi:hypothetical protein
MEQIAWLFKSKRGKRRETGRREQTAERGKTISHSITMFNRNSSFSLVRYFTDIENYMRVALTHSYHSFYFSRKKKARATASAVTNYLTWTFRASFMEVTLALFIFFMALIIIFALVIYWVGSHQPECIAVGPDNFVPVFADAYQLSWTTLSTVGLGIVGPRTATAHQRW